MPLPVPDPVDAMLLSHGLRRTLAARRLLKWMLAHREASFTHAQLWQQLRTPGGDKLDRVTLYRLVDRLTRAGLLTCRVDASRVRRYQALAVPAMGGPALVHFHCERCRCERSLAAVGDAGAAAWAQAAQLAVQTLQDKGYQGLSVDLAVRGLCAECVAGDPLGRGAAA